MQDMLKQSEIDEFLSSLGKMSVKLPPMPYLKPSQINLVEDEEERKKLERDLASIHYLYVYPLEKLLKYITNQMGQEYYELEYQDAHITQRAIMVEKLLEEKGYTREQVKKLVPTNEDEERLLLKARNLGFKDAIACYNEHRVAAASQFIQSLSNEEEIKKNVA